LQKTKADFKDQSFAQRRPMFETSFTMFFLPKIVKELFVKRLNASGFLYINFYSLLDVTHFR
jgi:hypothetical protein